MVKKILIGLGVLVAVFVVIVATRPEDFRVSRSAAIPAPAAAVFGHVNDLHKWSAWSPWAKLDPNAKESFNGPTAGTGASFSWDGNKDVGAGTMTIAESKPNELVRFHMEFVRPFEAASDAEFTFKSDGAGTIVTWTMSGKNNFIGKAVALFMDCDKMVGGQFEEGLANLKAVVAGKNDGV